MNALWAIWRAFYCGSRCIYSSQYALKSSRSRDIAELPTVCVLTKISDSIRLFRKTVDMETLVPVTQEAVLMDKCSGKLENSFVVSILCFRLRYAIVLPR
jgi:hypothetical protein